MILTVSICTLNREKQLNGCLKSLYQQSDKDFDIIIVDQSDKKTNYLKGCIKVKRYYLKEKNLSKARNLSIKMISSDVVVFTDDDCVTKSDWILEIKKSLTKVDFVSGRIITFDGKDFVRKQGKYKKRLKSINDSFFVSGGNFASYTKFIKSVGLFDEKMGSGTYFGSCEDTELAFRLTRRGYRGLYNPNAIVFHPSNENCSNKKLFSYSLGMGAFMKKALDYNLFYILYTIKEFSKRFIQIILYFFLNKNKYKGVLVMTKGLFMGLFSYKN